MSQNLKKEFKNTKTYTEIRTSKKTGNTYVVLVTEFILENGRAYKIESFLKNDQQFILGV